MCAVEPSSRARSLARLISLSTSKTTYPAHRRTHGGGAQGRWCWYGVQRQPNLERMDRAAPVR
jgi:hypothetical protein